MEIPIMNTKNATTSPKLVWNERGQIGCTLPGHAPYRGTDCAEFAVMPR